MDEREVPKIALSVDEAAAALSISRDTFERYVKDELRLVRLGRRTLVPVTELQRWIELTADRPVADLFR